MFAVNFHASALACPPCGSPLGSLAWCISLFRLLVRSRRCSFVRRFMSLLLVCRLIIVSSLLVSSSVSNASSSSSVIQAMNSSLLSVVTFLFISAFVISPSGSRLVLPSFIHIAIVRFQLSTSSEGPSAVITVVILVALPLAVRSACAMFAPSAPCDSAWMLSRTLSKHRIASSSAMCAYMNCPLYSLNLCPSMAVW